MKSTWFLVIASIAAPCVAQDTIPSSYATQTSWSGGPDWSVISDVPETLHEDALWYRKMGKHSRDRFTIFSR